jgi:tellurite resistance protein
MGSVAHRIGTLIDLFMGAACADADHGCEEKERLYVRALVADLLCTQELPPEVDAMIANFDHDKFDLRATVTEFLREPPMNKRRLMELVAYVTLSDGSQSAEEDTYLRDLGHALGMGVEEYRHLTNDPDMAHLRESFTDLARVPLNF